MPTHKERVKHLLINFEKNKKLLASLEKNETIREWREDYRSREHTGGLHSLDWTETKGHRNTNTSMQEKLFLEKESILQRLESVRYDVELTKLLLFQLDDIDQQLIQLRFVESMCIRDVCDSLYISKSTFYRRHEQILNVMAAYLKRFDTLTAEEKNESFE